MIEATDPRPRVNFSSMPQYVGKKVLLVGTPSPCDGNAVWLQTSDNGRVKVMTPSAAAYPQDVVEVEGTVTSPDTLQEDTRVIFGSNFDLPMYEEFMKLVHKQGVGKAILLP